MKLTLKLSYLMNNEFYINSIEIQFTRTLGTQLPSLQLVGSEVWNASGDWGRIVVQELQRINYSIALTSFELVGNGQLEIRPKKFRPYYYSRYSK